MVPNYWVIPENIHTIPPVASWNSEGVGSFLDRNISECIGGNAVWNSKFPDWGDVESLA